MKYLWAAYRKGALDHIHPVFTEDLSVEEFKQVVAAVIGEQRLTAWVMVAETPGGIRPVGLVLGWVSERVISVSKLISFPWASPRNVFESVINAFDVVRKQVYDESLDIDDPLRYMVALAFTEFRDKKFYEKVADAGVLRKVGHVYDMQPSGTSVLFQTKSPVRGK